MADFIVSDSGAEYSSIAAAYQAAAAQARSTGQSQNVVVKFGEYDESFTMDTDGVNLISFDANKSIQPIINGTVTVNFDSTAYVSEQKKASILSFKIQRVLFTGSNYQNVQLSGCDISSVLEASLVLDNDAISSQELGYLPSTVNAANCIFTSLSNSPAVEVSSGYFRANQITVSGLFSSQSIVVTALRNPTSTAQVGVNISEAQIIGQVLETYSDTPLYATLVLNRSNVTTSGVDFPPIYIVKGRAKLSYIILSNPESRYTVYSTPDSNVAYFNLSVPANTPAPPSQDIPRYRLSPDAAGAVVVNDQKGRLSSLVGTSYGEVLGWNPSHHRWEAMPSPSSDASVVTGDGTLTVGCAVAIDDTGFGTVADSTVDGKYPCVGFCISIVGDQATIKPSGLLDIFSGLAPKALYFLGQNGQIVTSVPVDAKIAQSLGQGVTETSAMVQVDVSPIYL